MAGPPKLCMVNNTNESHLKYTVCGVPVPKVTWGFTEGSTINSIIGTKREDLCYAHDYSLSIVPNMCGKVLHFDAVGYNNIKISWRKKLKKDGKSQFCLLYSEIKYLLFVFLFLPV